MISFIIVIALICFGLAYKYYGRWLNQYFLTDKDEEMPSIYLRDDMDYFPAPFGMLFAHHFSSIAGAGAIIGPVVAGAMFGWVPALLWIVFGCIFVGGVHDISSLAMSLKHDGLSLAEVVQRTFGRRVHFLILVVFWISLVLVVAAFLDLTAITFNEAPAVGFTVTLTVIMAFILGIGIYTFHIGLRNATFFLLPFFFYALYYGAYDGTIYKMFDLSINNWRVAIVGYCYLASVLPVWLLMEPRDYIASLFLYFGIAIGVVGMFIAGWQMPTNMLQPFYGWNAINENSYLWPFLFITVACGAVSGAHSMISGGTTPKQLAKKEQALSVGYGAMLLEGVVGIISLGTVIINGDFLAQSPLNCFAVGFGRMAQTLGFEHHLGSVMGFMLVNCLLLTTLDCLTRVGRYLLQEITHNRLSSFMATALTLLAAIGLVVLESSGKRMWEVIWPMFGATNQLIAGITLLLVCLWLLRIKYKKIAFVVFPAIFMLATSFTALVMFVWNDNNLGFLRLLSFILIFLTILLVWAVNAKVNLFKVLVDFVKGRKLEI